MVEQDATEVDRDTHDAPPDDQIAADADQQQPDMTQQSSDSDTFVSTEEEDNTGKQLCPICNKYFKSVAIHHGKMHKDVEKQAPTDHTDQLYS